MSSLYVIIGLSISVSTPVLIWPPGTANDDKSVLVSGNTFLSSKVSKLCVYISG